MQGGDGSGHDFRCPPAAYLSLPALRLPARTEVRARLWLQALGAHRGIRGLGRATGGDADTPERGVAAGSAEEEEEGRRGRDTCWGLGTGREGAAEPGDAAAVGGSAADRTEQPEACWEGPQSFEPLDRSGRRVSRWPAASLRRPRALRPLEHGRQIRDHVMQAEHGAPGVSLGSSARVTAFVRGPPKPLSRALVLLLLPHQISLFPPCLSLALQASPAPPQSLARSSCTVAASMHTNITCRYLPELSSIYLQVSTSTNRSLTPLCARICCLLPGLSGCIRWRFDHQRHG